MTCVPEESGDSTGTQVRLYVGLHSTVKRRIQVTLFETRGIVAKEVAGTVNWLIVAMSGDVA
jgi:hypothetical protein